MNSKKGPIAIHHRPGSFSDSWIQWCRDSGVQHKVVDAHRSDAIEQIRGCSALMWHWSHHDQSAALFARQLTMSLEKIGISVFPSSLSSWHYDDKVGQKYLLEAINAPIIPTWVFYSKNEALNWAHTTTFPKVFKLRGGAGSTNVHLVRTRQEAERLIRRSFGQGWSAAGSPLRAINERLWQFRRDRTLRSLIDISRGAYRAIRPHPDYRTAPRQRGYAYFQEFIASNDCDIRVIVIGCRAFAIKRMVREGDFRASGSGLIIYDPSSIPLECVRVAFDVSSNLEAQSVAYDFMLSDGKPVIGEISYAFSFQAYMDCPGWWDSDLNWHSGPFKPQVFMIEDMVAQIESQA